MSAGVEAPLVRQFDLLATAPGGIARLRELILTLAVQGKLVPQEAGDEPASVLLQRIRAEKDRLIAAGEIKREKVRQPVDAENAPFDLPTGWEWARLEELSLAIVDCPHSTPSFISNGYLCIDTNSFKDGRLLPHKLRYVDEPTFINRNARLQPQPGDLVFAREGSVGESVIIPEGVVSCLGQRVMLFRFSELISNQYIRLALTSREFLGELLSLHKGIGAKHVNVGDMRMAAVPVPPADQQSRIFTRVEELMRLCDALEQQRHLETAQHAQLLNTLLGTLTDCTSPDELAANWQRVSDHFDLLLDRPKAVDALEQTILQLAVRGLLVPQDPADESAKACLERIRSSRISERLIAKAERARLAAATNDAERHTPLPGGWAWACVAEFAQSRLGKMLDKAKNTGKLYPYLRNTNVQWGRIDIDDVKFIRLDDHEVEEYRLQFGDLLVCEGGEPGRCAIWSNQSTEMYFQKAPHRIRPEGGISPEFLAFCLEADAQSGRLAQQFTGATIKHFAGQELDKYAVALPPITEQTRIVARVAQLRDLCTTLRQHLTAGQTTQRHLAEALVEV